jgi:curved DNA-binding protein CbpA
MSFLQPGGKGSDPVQKTINVTLIVCNAERSDDKDERSRNKVFGPLSSYTYQRPSFDSHNAEQTAIPTMPANMSCPFEILGVNADASEDDIKEAYKRLALRWHPDTNPNNVNEAEEMFKAITAAFEQLQDPAKKQKAQRKAKYAEPTDATPNQKRDFERKRDARRDARARQARAREEAAREVRVRAQKAADAAEKQREFEREQEARRKANQRHADRERARQGLDRNQAQPKDHMCDAPTPRQHFVPKSLGQEWNAWFEVGQQHCRQASNAFSDISDIHELEGGSNDQTLKKKLLYQASLYDALANRLRRLAQSQGEQDLPRHSPGVRQPRGGEDARRPHGNSGEAKPEPRHNGRHDHDHKAKPDPTDTFDEMIIRSGSALELTRHLLKAFIQLQLFTDFAIKTQVVQRPDARHRHLTRARQAIETLQERLLQIGYRYRRYRLDGLALHLPDLANNWLREVSDMQSMLQNGKKIVEAGVKDLPLDEALSAKFRLWKPSEYWSLSQRERLWNALSVFRELVAVYLEARQIDRGRNHGRW